MKNNAEIYLEHIEEIFGEDYIIRKIDASDEKTPIHIFEFHDLPEEGMTTFIL